jgi:hypothetical protein
MFSRVWRLQSAVDRIRHVQDIDWSNLALDSGYYDEGDRLGFVILARDGVQLMYQTRDSLRNDVPAFADQKFESCNPLYFIVDALNDVERWLAGVQKVMPRRDTFYGATEFSVREPVRLCRLLFRAQRALGDGAMLRGQIGDHGDEMAGIKWLRHVDLKAGGQNRIAVDSRCISG